MITIRTETPADEAAIRRVTVDAFAASPFGHHGEADLIDAVRAGGPPYLSLVACAAGEVVGHLLLSRVEIHPAGDGETSPRLIGMGLAPMAVAPTHQRSGIGSSLVTRGLAMLTEQRRPFVVVLGHPDYYPRFGFEPASAYGVTHGFVGLSQELFFLKRLGDAQSGVFSAKGAGRAFYLPEFGPQHLREGS